jgi:hypothetical protein
MASVLKIMRPKVYKVELGEKEYELRYDMNTFAKMEEMFGSVESALGSLDKQGKGKIEAILDIFYIGLLGNKDFDYSLEDFKKEISFASLGGVMELVLEALGSALPTDEKEVKKGKN